MTAKTYHGHTQTIGNSDLDALWATATAAALATTAASQQWGPTRAIGAFTGRNYTYNGGTAIVSGGAAQIAGGSLTLNDNAVSYIERTYAGVVSANIAGFTTGLIAMAKVTVAAGVIAAIEDWRPMFGPFPYYAVAAGETGVTDPRYLGGYMARYGVVANGTDQSTAIRNAVLSAAALGRDVIVPNATIIAKNILADSALTFTGEGRLSTLKLAPLAALDGSPIVNVSVAGCTFQGIAFDGNKAAQPADGFADSFDTGPNNTGRAYRAAIKFKDPSYALAGLTVDRCSFVNTYGACVATNGVSRVTVTDCVADSCNFELAFIYNFGGVSATKNHRVVRNRLTNGGSGHATVNGDCFVLSNAANFVVSDNEADGFERNLVKIELGAGGIVANNVGQNNTKATFEGIQLQGTTSDVTVIGNRLQNVQKGITMNGNMTNVSIVGNNVDTPLDPTAGDAISIGSGALSNVVIAGNVLRGVLRNCIGIQPSGAVRGLSITGNIGTTTGTLTGCGLLLNVTGGNWRDVLVDDNEFDCGNVVLNAAGIYITSSDASTVALLKVTNNLVDVGAGHNGIREAVACVASGICDNNLLDGAIFLQSAGFTLGTNNLVLAGSTITPASSFVKTVLTTPYTASPSDRQILVNLTVPGASTIILPQTPVAGVVYSVKDAKGDAGTNTITVQDFGAGGIEGGFQPISTNRGELLLIWSGTNWNIVGRYSAPLTAIGTPNTQTAAYVQADVASLKNAIDGIRNALTAAKITL